MISQRPYLLPPAMVLLHLLSARTLEPVWERISERWGASRWPWQKFSDQQNSNENISRLKTVQIFCRFIGKRSVLNCFHVYSLQTIGHLCSSFSPPFTGRSSRQSRAGYSLHAEIHIINYMHTIYPSVNLHDGFTGKSMGTPKVQIASKWGLVQSLVNATTWRRTTSPPQIKLHKSLNISSKRIQITLYKQSTSRVQTWIQAVHAVLRSLAALHFTMNTQVTVYIENLFSRQAVAVHSSVCNECCTLNIFEQCPCSKFPHPPCCLRPNTGCLSCK